MFQHDEFVFSDLEGTTLERLLLYVDPEGVPWIAFIKATGVHWQRFFLDAGHGFWGEFDDDEIEEELEEVGIVDYGEKLGDLLDISRAEEGRLTVEFESEGLDGLLADVLDRYASSLQTRRIALVTECDPELRVLFDRKLVTRVLENMLGNALRYVTSGGVIEVFLKRDGESALLQIANDGPPIAPETRSRLFEKYGMGRGGGDSNRGLGLYFCRLVVAEHGGTIGVRERDGGGVCFEIRLPLLGSRLQQSMQATPISASARSVIAP